MIFLKTKNEKIFLAALLICGALFFAQATKAATVTWDNSSADGLWSTATNWSGDTVPTSTDDVVFDGTSNTNATLELGVGGITVNSLSLNSGYTNTLTLKRTNTGGPGQFTATGNITVNSGNIVAEGNPSAINAAAGGTAQVPYGEGIVFNAANITVAEGASLNADGKGFAGDNGPGKASTAGVAAASGSSYGGKGSIADPVYNSPIISLPGSTYGTETTPTALGSGGTFGWDTTGGYGGGALKLIVTGNILVNGTLSTKGLQTTGHAYAGSGSGGSIWVTSGTLAGTGIISADGGYGLPAGSGGGGRIDISNTTNNFAGSITVSQGGGASRGYPGTILFPQSSGTGLTLDNFKPTNSIALGNNSITFGSVEVQSGNTLTLSSSYNNSTLSANDVKVYGTLTLGQNYTDQHASFAFSSIDVYSAGILNIYRDKTEAGGDYNFNDVTVQNGGEIDLFGNIYVVNSMAGGTSELPYGAGPTINANNITVDSGGIISAEGRGFYQESRNFWAGTNAPGKGLDSSGSLGAGGGGYGGIGGSGAQASALGGILYGSSVTPTALGSNGGYGGYGGATAPGGGAVKLVVASSFIQNGIISANGISPAHSHQGGGSGGSIWISTNSFSGSSGVIRANGGNSGPATGGGGGGGRVRVEYANKTYSGTMTATGGTGYQNGAAGMVNEDNTTSNTAPSAPTLSIPADSATLNLINPLFQFSTTDSDYDYLKYKIEIATDSGFNSIVQTIDQTSSQAGWFGQTEQTRTAYAPSLTAAHILQTALSSNTQYYWKVSAIDPAGTNTWSATSASRTFTTGSAAGNYWLNTSGDGLWATDANWSLGHKPIADEAIVFDGNLSNTNCLVDVYTSLNSVSLDSLTLNSTYAKTLTLKRVDTGGPGELTVTGDIIVNGGNIIAEGNPSAINATAGGTAQVPYGEGIVFNAANITVASGASINADSKGFAPNTGPGKGTANVFWAYGSGGGYGGVGGPSVNSGAGADPGGVIYGNAAHPTALGSSGHGGNTASGTIGIGGGAIKLIVTGALTVDGKLSAAGSNGYINSGGGSGGSLWLSEGALQGSGIISANGGAQGGNGGSGGGGRIDVSGTTNNFSGQFQILGGTGDRGSQIGTIIFPQSSGTGLTLDNFTPTVSMVLGQNMTLGNVTINNGITLTLDAHSSNGNTYNINSLTVNTGGNIIALGDPTQVNADAGGTADVPYGVGININAANIAVASGASINADGKGFGNTAGPGKGNYGEYGSGAGYGGLGGITHPNFYRAGGGTYGTAIAPTALGSGGGNGQSGAGGGGGGGIKLVVTETLTLNGQFTANGANGGTGWGGGGGSGGSIWLITNIFAGTNPAANISVNGGTSGSAQTGGGGGGRILVEYADKTYTGSITATGGTGYQNGADGSIRTGYLSGNLVSSIYDSTSEKNMISGLRWTETLPAVTSVTLFLRSGGSAEEVAASDWSEIASSHSDGTLTAGCSRNGSAVICDNTVIPTALKDLTNDRFFQYKAVLASQDLSSTPEIDNIAVVYVVNSPPQFDSTYGTNGVTTNQISNSNDANWGKVKIDYSIRDIDTESGSFTANYVTPTFEYTTDGTTYHDVDLSRVTFGTAPQGGGYNTYQSKTTNKVLQPTLDGNGNETAANYLTYTAYWDAKAQIAGTYSATFKIRVKVNDNEGANNLVTAIGNETALDVKNPTGLTLTIEGATKKLTMATPTENSSYQMSLSNTAGVFNSFIAFASPYTYASLTADPATVYLRIRDAYGNYTDLSAQTPANPQAISFFDTSDPDVDMWREFITWSSISEAEAGAGFAHYNIWRKIDDGTYTIVNEENDRQRNYYVDPNLDTTKTYYYKVTSEDIAGNTSNFTSVVSDQPDGQGSSDRTPPSISAVSVSDVETTSAKITWTTDELSDSFVGYSINTSYLPERGLVTLSTEHELTLTGLAPSTIYNIRIKSRDVQSNLGQADKDNPGLNDISDFTFTTDDGPAISQITVSAISNTQATIVWKTNTDSSTFVGYASALDINGAMVDPVEVGTPDLVGGNAPYSHSQTITGLDPDTTYFFYAKSIDAALPIGNVAFDNNGGNFYELLTTEDLTDPIITATDEPVISNNQAAIYWLTDEPASSQVEYGTVPGGSYTLTEKITDMNRSHYVILSSLDPLTTYYYKVISADINGNEAISELESSFLTQNNPEFQHAPLEKITDVSEPPSIITDTKAVITFKTDQPAQCSIEYGTAAGNFSEVPFTETEYNQSHSMHMTGLIFSTTYYYKITCEDNLGTVVESAVNESDVPYSFTTMEQQFGTSQTDTTAPSISGVSAGTITGESATITWDTDEATNSLIQYGITSGTYENVAGDGLALTDTALFDTAHTVIVNNLTPGTKYYYIAVSYDASGNIGQSSEASFTTASPSSLSSIQIISTSLNSVTISWTTSQTMTSIVEYGLTINYGEIKQSNTATKIHQVELAGLSTATLYHFRVKGKDASNNLFSSGDYTFQPKSPPRILSNSIASVNEKGAVIAFTTDIPASSLITFVNADDPADSGSQGKPELATQHSVELKNLKAGATYALKLAVTDEQGNQTTMDLKSLQTLKDENPPEIDQVKTDSALAQNDKVQTIISWNTDELATTAFFYKEGVTGEFKEVSISEGYTTNHVVVSTIFKAGTVYLFRVKSVDQSGNERISADFSMLTPSKKENVVQIIINNFQDIFSWARVARS